MLLRTASFFFAVFLCLGVGSDNVARAQAPMVPGERMAEVNGTRLWYKVAGVACAGEAPVFYLAGGPGYNSYSFEKTIGAQLERHVQMIYFDERGTGRSERPKSGDYAMTTLVEDIETLRQQLGLPQLSLMGQSFGGTIALEYARAHPEHLQKLILVDAAADLPGLFASWQKEIETRYGADWKKVLSSPEGRALRAAQRSGSRCAITKARFNAEMDVLNSPGHVDFHHWQQFRDQRREREQETLDKASGLSNTGEMNRTYFSGGAPFLCYKFRAYRRLTLPVLVIEGKYDGAVPPEQAKTLVENLPNARYDEFEDSAHFPYAEEPVKFERDVAAFLSARP